MLTRSPTLDSYGYLWWLNRGAAAKPHLPASAFSALGAGNNVIWCDPDRDLVAVLRWIDKSALDGFLLRLVAADAIGFERLSNLDELPDHGFTVACFPIKIVGAGAGWARAVALIED